MSDRKVLNEIAELKARIKFLERRLGIKKSRLLSSETDGTLKPIDKGTAPLGVANKESPMT